MNTRHLRFSSHSSNSPNTASDITNSQVPTVTVTRATPSGGQTPGRTDATACPSNPTPKYIAGKATGRIHSSPTYASHAPAILTNTPTPRMMEAINPTSDGQG